MPGDNIVTDIFHDVFWNPGLNFFVTHATDSRGPFLGRIQNGYCAAGAVATALLTAKSDAPTGPAAAAASAAKAFSIPAYGRDLALFFHQNVIEASNGFVQLLAKTFSTFRIGFARIFTDTASSTGSTGSTGTTSLAAICTLACAAFAAPGLTHAAYAAGQSHAAVATSVGTATFTIATSSTAEAADTGNLNPWNAHAACRPAHRTTRRTAAGGAAAGRTAT